MVVYASLPIILIFVVLVPSGERHLGLTLPTVAQISSLLNITAPIADVASATTGR
jgi:hypothetical protein